MKNQTHHNQRLKFISSRDLTYMPNKRKIEAERDVDDDDDDDHCAEGQTLS